MTNTAHGQIEYKLWQGFSLCVKLDFNGEQDRRYNYPPLIRDGKYVYALPGGLEICL